MEDTKKPTFWVEIDGKPLPDGKTVDIFYADMFIPGNDDDRGVLVVHPTSEGLIMDVWGTRETHLDTNEGTSSEMAQEIVDRLCGDNE